MWDIFKKDNSPEEEEKDDSIIYNHKEFCDFIRIFRKKNTELRKWVSYPLWILSYLPYMLFIVSMTIMIAMILWCVHSAPRRKYPASTHKMVIKEGILWDTVEYHER